MANFKELVLTVGGRIHPLMGPIFSGRPSSVGVGDTCTMCIGDTPAVADSAIRDSNGRTAFVCLPHELLLHRAFDTRGIDGVSEYQAYALDTMMEGVTCPRWMPAPLYARLLARAAHWARLLAVLTVVPKALPLLDTRAAKAEDLGAEARRTITPTN